MNKIPSNHISILIELQLMKMGCGPIGGRERRWVWQENDLLEKNMNEHVDKQYSFLCGFASYIIAELVFPLQDYIKKTSDKM